MSRCRVHIKQQRLQHNRSTLHQVHIQQYLKITYSQQAMPKPIAKAVLECTISKADMHECLLSCLGKHKLLVLQHVHNLITRTCLGIRDQALHQLSTVDEYCSDMIIDA